MNGDCASIRSEVERAKASAPWPESLRTSVRNHLDSCAKCRAELLVEAAIADSWAEVHARPTIDDERVIDRIHASLRGKELENAGTFRGRTPARWLIPVGLAAAACVALVWLWPSGPTRRGFITKVTATKETDATLGSVEYFRIAVEVSDPAYIRLAVRESNGAVRLPSANAATSTAEPIAGNWEGRVYRSCPSEADCHRTHAFVLACSQKVPVTSDAIVSVPGDPGNGADDGVMARAAKAIEDRFGCEVRWLALR